MDRCDSKKWNLKTHLFGKDWTTCSIFDNNFGLNLQHNWELGHVRFYDNLDHYIH